MQFNGILWHFKQQEFILISSCLVFEHVLKDESFSRWQWISQTDIN